MNIWHFSANLMGILLELPIYIVYSHTVNFTFADIVHKPAVLVTACQTSWNS
jgi:hypothetical protein